ncbi:50S ribosomal protein L10 [Rhabdothermincola sp.]|uniref:50S ribosomal protein L10 n=1 Tax=Rhabdothermincola sp. TaxID=2820405 RepID=UPI002FE19F3B
MENPRPEKVAVVDEVRQRFAESDAALLTEYRGLDVAAMGELRRALRAAGGDYKIYKNTLVRFATRDLGLEIDEMLTGPTAIAFVPRAGEGDPVVVAKALRDFARGHPALVLKGGVLGDRILTEAEARALAEVAPREELLAQLAGLMAAPMQQFAGLLQAVPQKFAYALAALVEAGGPAGAPTGEAEASIDTTEPAGVADATPAPEPATPEVAGDDTTAPAEEAGAHPDDAVAEPATARAEPATEES